MKQSSVYNILLLAIILAIFPTLTTRADSNPINSQPGSVDDPLITKSYLDQNIKQLIANELSKLNLSEDKLKQIVATEVAKNKPADQPAQQATNGSSNLTILKLEPGQSLYGGSGTELIVRTGKTVVFSSDENGIANVTIGKDIVAGQAVELNHLLIVPREGRGIKPDPKNKDDIYVMVRGNYLLTNADGSKVSP